MEGWCGAALAADGGGRTSAGLDAGPIHQGRKEEIRRKVSDGYSIPARRINDKMPKFGATAKCQKTAARVRLRMDILDKKRCSL
jgi:hypothetical protein